MNFTIPADKADQINAWMQERHRQNALAQGREDAYYGASGGVFSYEFTPTSLGLIIKIKENLTGEVLDITDYKEW